MRTPRQVKDRRARSQAGMTLAELILATGLAAIVMASMISIVDSALTLWTKGETSRQGREASAAIASMMAHDLRQLHGSAEGDVLIDWEVFDVDRDGQVERLWPRMRFIRDASAREAAWIGRRALAEAARIERDRKRLEAGDDAEVLAEQLSEEEILNAAGVSRQDMALGQGAAVDTSASELLEILYAVVPEGDTGWKKYSGRLVRAERVHRAGSPPVLLRADAFDSRGLPDPTLAKEVATGVLWMRPLMATQTTRIVPPATNEERPAWTTGAKSLLDAATSWDAWGRGRPSLEVTDWNEPAPGMPKPGIKPLLPRRIRLELEMQRPSDAKRAPELLDVLDEAATSFDVTAGRRLAEAVGRDVMVGGEWMKITSIQGDSVTVRRGTRSTKARVHASGEKVMLGYPVILDLPIVMYEDDWRVGQSSVDKRDAKKAGDAKTEGSR
ncbi:hypothetical protein Poly30_19780 [Planctomycetes bacterium Poly30]|uniref:Uncharacterized protein n=1 Tax=Saltatorellus ferox TaxID=2528018 RepID=A0A518EQV3_9BACT|nr:hypothetical protein Poly30_19780 [Planctomycetes bacterium Poly30]